MSIITKNFKKKLSKKSIFIEKKILSENCGCQDQYATALGGFNEIIFKKKIFH